MLLILWWDPQCFSVWGVKPLPGCCFASPLKWSPEQLSRTSKWSKIWLSGTPKLSKIWLLGTPKWSKLWLSGKPKRSKILNLKKCKWFFFVISNLKTNIIPQIAMEGGGMVQGVTINYDFFYFFWPNKLNMPIKMRKKLVDWL